MEPLLMPFQQHPFNGDIYVEQIFVQLRDKFKLKTAIETGTCLGYTSRWLASKFDLVYTIEISQQYRDISLGRFRDIHNIESLLGSSSELLPSVLEKVESDTMIFLDAHWGEEYCPLQDELKAIANRGIKPCIAIHDFVVPDNNEFGYDYFQGQPFNFNWLKLDFDAIYGVNNYDFFYNSKVYEHSAKRGVIFVTPKA